MMHLLAMGGVIKAGDQGLLRVGFQCMTHIPLYIFSSLENERNVKYTVMNLLIKPCICMQLSIDNTVEVDLTFT